VGFVSCKRTDAVVEPLSYVLDYGTDCSSVDGDKMYTQS